VNDTLRQVTRYYPVFADLAGRVCLVVGGGPVGEERARRLAESGARVRVVAPRVTPGLAVLAAQGAVSDLREREYTDDDLDGCALVIAATDRREVNRRVRDDARRRGVPCNVADDPAAGDFIVPAVVRRGDLTLAVSTGGASPTVAAHVRGRLEESFGPEWADLLRMLGEARDALKRRHPDTAARSARVRRVLASDVPGLLAEGRLDDAGRRMRELLDLEVGSCT